MALDNVERFAKLKKQVAVARAKRDKARGARDELLKRLKVEFNCSSVGEAKKLLKQLQREAKHAQAKFEEALDEFEARWAKHLK